MDIKVLFHSQDGVRHCPDGFAAAWAMWHFIGDNAVYLPAIHGQEPPGEINNGDIVFMVDFSYPRDVLIALSNRLTRLVILDHHKTAEFALRGIQKELGCPSFVQFDMQQSGAQLAWEHCRTNVSRTTKKAPALIEYVADRDLWKKELPGTEEISRALASFPQDFMVWDTLANLPNYVDFMQRIGEPLLEQHNQEVIELAASAAWAFDWLGRFDVRVTNTDQYGLVSDALNLCCNQYETADFAVNFWQTGDRVKMELRSIGDFDVSEVAKHFGGGGHKNAAGCETNYKDPRIAALQRAVL